MIIEGKYSNAEIMTDLIDDVTINQIQLMVNDKNFSNPIKIMPDCHSGKGAVIGFTMKMADSLIPNIIGVDIGCGMLTANLGNLEYDRKEVDEAIRNIIPFGININDKNYVLENDYNFFNKIQMYVDKIINDLNKNFNKLYSDMLIPSPEFNYQYFLNMCKRIGIDSLYVEKSLKSIGSGNHFIEFGKGNKSNDLFVTIHTGSRKLGQKVASYWQKIANKKDVIDIKSLKEKYNGIELGNKIKELKNKNKSNFGSLKNIDMFNYIFDMIFTQEYAKLNRQLILEEILNYFNVKYKEKIETIHNYINFDDYIIRKGSVASYQNEKLIIPLNMEDGILLCFGKSNKDWNYSAPHGAGRIMSRSKASSIINKDIFVNSMEKKDIYSSYIPIDEVKGAYKSSDIIIENIKPTVNIIEKIIPVHNIKSNDVKHSWKKLKK